MNGDPWVTVPRIPYNNLVQTNPGLVPGLKTIWVTDHFGLSAFIRVFPRSISLPQSKQRKLNPFIRVHLRLSASHFTPPRSEQESSLATFFVAGTSGSSGTFGTSGSSGSSP